MVWFVNVYTNLQTRFRNPSACTVVNVYKNVCKCTQRAPSVDKYLHLTYIKGWELARYTVKADCYREVTKHRSAPRDWTFQRTGLNQRSKELLYSLRGLKSALIFCFSKKKKCWFALALIACLMWSSTPVGWVLEVALAVCRGSESS